MKMQMERKNGREGGRKRRKADGRAAALRDSSWPPISV